MQLTQPSPDEELRRGGVSAGSPAPPPPARKDNAFQGKLYLGPEQAQKELEHLSLLCSAQDDDPQPLEAAAEALREAGYKQEVSKILHRALMSPDVNPHVGALWVRRVVSRRRWDGHYPKHMDKLCRRRGEVGRRAVIEFLRLAAAKGLSRHVSRVLRRHGRWLRNHPQGWRVGIRVLASQGRYRKLIDWFGDWRTRSDLDLELLFCLAVALRTSGQEREGHEVVRLALTKQEQSQQYRILKLWFAFEEAVAGNTQTALEQFKDLQPRDLDEYSTCLYYLTRGLIRVQQTEPAERKEAFERDYHRISERFRSTRVHQCGTLVRREYRRCVCRMAKDAGAWGQSVQAVWQSADSWLFLLPLLVVPPFQLLAPLYLFRLAVRPRLHLPQAGV